MIVKTRDPFDFITTYLVFREKKNPNIYILNSLFLSVLCVSVSCSVVSDSL